MWGSPPKFMLIKMATIETRDYYTEGGRAERVEKLLVTMLSTWVIDSFRTQTSASGNIPKY